MDKVNSISDSMIKTLKGLTKKNDVSSKMKTDLDLQTQDWMKLLVAQLKNQDMYNQTDMQEMTQQMAQFSNIQAIQNMVSMQENMFAMYNTSYAASLIGKEVTAAEVKVVQTVNGKTEDKVITTRGKVTGVTLFDGEPYVYIGEKKFALGQIMVVGDVPNDKAADKPNAENNAGSSGNAGSTGSTGTTGNTTGTANNSGDTGNTTNAGNANATQP